MAHKNKKKLSGISHYFNNQTKEQINNSADVIVRESFLRAVRETTDNFGMERYAVERIQGMVELLEQFVGVREELE